MFFSLLFFFEEFRNICLKNYSLDPVWYYTSPGLSWDALLKHSEVKLELLTDPDKLLLFEKGIRGGISMISKRYGQANNKYMEEKYDPSHPSKYLAYLDANNLFGWAMMKPLPVGDFKWMEERELEHWRTFHVFWRWIWNIQEISMICIMIIPLLRKDSRLEVLKS